MFKTLNNLQFTNHNSPQGNSPQTTGELFAVNCFAVNCLCGELPLR
jgi:hypothetical protein